MSTHSEASSLLSNHGLKLEVMRAASPIVITSGGVTSVCHETEVIDMQYEYRDIDDPLYDIMDCFDAAREGRLGFSEVDQKISEILLSLQADLDTTEKTTEAVDFLIADLCETDTYEVAVSKETAIRISGHLRKSGLLENRNFTTKLMVRILIRENIYSGECFDFFE
jgi:hypothetical protein